jgi:hypothetical protein
VWNQFVDDFSDTIVAALGEVSPEGSWTTVEDDPGCVKTLGLV